MLSKHATLYVEYTSMFRNYFACVADIIADMEPGEPSPPLMCVEDWRVPANILQDLKDGSTYLMFNEKEMEVIEHCNVNDIPLVIVVSHQDKIWMVINGEDCNY